MKNGNSSNVFALAFETSRQMTSSCAFVDLYLFCFAVLISKARSTPPLHARRAVLPCLAARAGKKKQLLQRSFIYTRIRELYKIEASAPGYVLRRVTWS